MMLCMRTTVDLPDDVHARAKALAHDRGQSLSAALAAIITQYLTSNQGTPADSAETDKLTGLPVLHFGRIITSEDVASLWDEE
jgi:predicted transcriptional regulator